MQGRVVNLSLSTAHRFEKQRVVRARLLEGLGVEGDVHSGRTVKHRSRVASDPTQPNLRQVHLIGAELLRELEQAGYDVAPGRLGENVLTEGLDLLSLPTGTRLALGPDAVVELTGLRNPCAQLNEVGPGLMQRLVHRDDADRLVRRAGVMAIVLATGDVREEDPIEVRLPPEPHVAMDRV
jgi:MOSC domain-containing protein YiiM